MAEKKIIIHPGCIEMKLDHSDLATRTHAQEVMAAINAALEDPGKLVVTDDLPVSMSGPFSTRLATPQLNADTYLLRDDDTSVIRDCVGPGDVVTLLGAYGDVCIGWAEEYVEEVGGKSVRHPTGIFTPKT